MVDHPKFQKTAENRDSATPWKAHPVGSTFLFLGFVAFDLHHLRIFSGIYPTIPKLYANYVVFDLHKDK